MEPKLNTTDRMIATVIQEYAKEYRRLDLERRIKIKIIKEHGRKIGVEAKKYRGL